MKNYIHKTETIKIDGKDVKVDAEIKDLILALNNLELKTEFSCQGGFNQYDYKEEVYVVIDMSNMRVAIEDNKLILRWKRTN